MAYIALSPARTPCSRRHEVNLALSRCVHQRQQGGQELALAGHRPLLDHPTPPNKGLYGPRNGHRGSPCTAPLHHLDAPPGAPLKPPNAPWSDAPIHLHHVPPICNGAGMMVHVQMYLSCPQCGHSWRSQSTSGKTRCPSCNTRVYVPAAVRHRAKQAPGELIFDVASGRLQRL
jgi:DNA-directed RNA polymerase subunit RPC12/RpoP